MCQKEKPPLSKGGGRRRRTEGFRRALPGCPSHLRTARNPSASLRSAPPFDKGGFSVGAGHARPAALRQAHRSGAATQGRGPQYKKAGSRTVLSPTACGRSPLAEGAKGGTRLFRQSEPPLSKGGGRRRRTEGFRRALPGCPSHLRTARNLSASLRSAPPFDKGGSDVGAGHARPAALRQAHRSRAAAHDPCRNIKRRTPHLCAASAQTKIIFSFSP